MNLRMYYICNSESTEWSSCTRYSSHLHIHGEGVCPSLFLGMNRSGGGLRGDAHFLESSLLQLQHYASLRALEDGHRLSVEDAHHGVVVHLVGRGQVEKGRAVGVSVRKYVRTYVQFVHQWGRVGPPYLNDPVPYSERAISFGSTTWDDFGDEDAIISLNVHVVLATSYTEPETCTDHTRIHTISTQQATPACLSNTHPHTHTQLYSI